MKKIKTKKTFRIIVNGNDVITIPDFDRKYFILNDISPRFQWEANSGYCGEVSMISAGLFYGQYLSQYDVRLLASKKNQLGANQLLLGVNDTVAAKSLRLKYKTKTSLDSESFMKWVKQYVGLGFPVIIGVFNNESILYNNTKKSAGDPVYDHITPVMGFGSDEPLSKNFNNADKILISDNGLFYPGNSAIPPDTVGYCYEYEMKDFFSSRINANNPDGNLYSLLELPEYQTPSKTKCNYAIAILGVMGEEETFPVRIKTNLNYEAPCIKDKSSERPASMDLKLTVTVSKLKPNISYNLYCYTDENAVPVKNFNKKSKKGSLFRTIKISSGTSYTTTLKIKSDQKVFFRAVLAEK